MPASDHRLTSREMATFVTDGYLRFDALVPSDINERVMSELSTRLPGKIKQAVGLPLDDGAPPGPDSLTPLSEIYPPPSVLGEYLRLPQVRGIIESLVGADPLYDHDFIHFLPAGSEYRQHLHVDAIIDSPDPTFDVQLFYFPVEVAPGAGGTRFVPGSHLRRTRAEGVCRYQHLLGEQQYAGPPGTLLVFHQALWHAGQPNPSGQDRWMHKIRLNPRVRQVRLWNIDDLADFQNDAADHVFASVQPDRAASVLRKMQPWQQGHEARYELVQRAKLWRYLTGDERYDVDYYLTRIEQRSALLGGGAH